MTPSQPVVRVTQILVTAGYRSCLMPFTVASIPFEFAALLVGSERSLDLVVVIDTLTESSTRIRQKIESLSRALDVVASRRPLTVVLVGPPPLTLILEALAKVSRVLVVGTPMVKAAQLKSWRKAAALTQRKAAAAVPMPLSRLTFAELDQAVLTDAEIMKLKNVYRTHIRDSARQALMEMSLMEISVELKQGDSGTKQLTAAV
jgi:hypothetical protein